MQNSSILLIDYFYYLFLQILITTLSKLKNEELPRPQNMLIDFDFDLTSMPFIKNICF